MDRTEYLDSILAVGIRNRQNALRRRAFAQMNADAILYPSHTFSAVFNRAMDRFVPRGRYFSPSWTPEARDAFYGATFKTAGYVKGGKAVWWEL